MSRRGLAATALVTLPLFALATWWAAAVPVGAWESDVVAAIQLPDGLLGTAVLVIDTLGSLWIWAIMLAGLTLVGVALGHVAAARLIALTFAADLTAAAVKLLVARDRPEGALVQHFLGQESFAFPSGHVVRATALVAVLAWLVAPAAWRLPVALVGAIIAGLVMGYARLAVGMHWPSDVLGGLLLGIGWFAATTLLLLRRPG